MINNTHSAQRPRILSAGAFFVNFNAASLVDISTIAIYHTRNHIADIFCKPKFKKTDMN